MGLDVRYESGRDEWIVCLLPFVTIFVVVALLGYIVSPSKKELDARTDREASCQNSCSPYLGVMKFKDMSGTNGKCVCDLTKLFKGSYIPQ